MGLGSGRPNRARATFVARAVGAGLVVALIACSAASEGVDSRNLDLSDRTIDEILVLLDDDDPAGRQAAARELVRRGPAAVGPALDLLERSVGVPGRLNLTEELLRVLERIFAFPLIPRDRLLEVLGELADARRDLRTVRRDLAELTAEELADRVGSVYDVVKARLDALDAATSEGRIDRVASRLLRGFYRTLLDRLGLVLITSFRAGGPTGDAGRLIDSLLEEIVRNLRERIDEHGDLDGDGLPTSFELQHGLDPDRDDADEDPDDDGFTNREELERGTDPRSRDPVDAVADRPNLLFIVTDDQRHDMRS